VKPCRSCQRRRSPKIASVIGNSRIDRRLGIDAGRDARGLAGYLIVYQVLTAAASLRG
jgi:hypothetical protein